jgi:hypothetical protein
MANRKPLTDEDGEVRELTAEDLAQMIPFSSLPQELQSLLSESKQIKPDAKPTSAHDPAA